MMDSAPRILHGSTPEKDRLWSNLGQLCHDFIYRAHEGICASIDDRVNSNRMEGSDLAKGWRYQASFTWALVKINVVERVSAWLKNPPFLTNVHSAEVAALTEKVAGYLLSEGNERYASRFIPSAGVPVSKDLIAMAEEAKMPLFARCLEQKYMDDNAPG